MTVYVTILMVVGINPIYVLAGAGTERPKALLALEQYRLRHFTKGVIEWHVHPGPMHPLDVIHHTSRFAGKSQIFISRGDDDGVTSFDLQGRPSRVHLYSMRPGDGSYWTTTGTSASVTIYPADSIVDKASSLLDVRTVDLSVEFKWFSEVHTALWKSGLEKHGAVTYDERVEHGLHVVTATARGPEGHTTQYAWWLDPTRGWSPVRTEYRVDGERIKQARMTVKSWNGVWFPATILRFSKWRGNGRKPSSDIVIDSVRIDDSLPDAFGPADIGVEVGTNVSYADTHSRKAHWLMWDGTKGIDPMEFARKLGAGELKRGPNFMRALGLDKKMSAYHTPRAPTAGRLKGLSAEAVVRVIADEWERYVRQFIERNRLSATQTESAMAVLADCRKEAQRYVSAHQKEFDTLGLPSNRRRSLKRAEQLRRLEKYYGIKPPPAGRASDPKREEVRRRLYAPIDAIFEHRLKPRLDALLTAEQRAGP